MLIPDWREGGPRSDLAQAAGSSWLVMSVWVPGLLEVGTASVSVSVLGVEYGGPGRWDGQEY